jgi:hypothetical protein
VVIPFEQVNKQIFIRVSVGSAKPVWFVLDTGAKPAIIDLALAKSLGLEMAEPVPVGGGGKNVIMGNFLKNSRFRVVGLDDFSQPLTIAVPLTDLANASGHEFAGVLGFDFIRQFVVQIDYVKKSITLHDKTDYQYRGNGETFPITFNAAAHPRIRAQILEAGRAPIDGEFVFDLGSGATVMLNKPFVEAQQFLRPDRKTVPFLEGRGLGGEIPGRVGRIEGLKIGKYVIENPVAVFSQATSGPFASSESQGNIGAAVLEKFKIILDYSNKRIFLEPNSQFGKPLEYSRSGLSLVSFGQDYREYKIAAVADHSAASDAQLRAGDVLVAIDGRPVSEFSLSRIRQLFQEAQECELTVKSGNETRRVRLKLRRQI